MSAGIKTEPTDRGFERGDFVDHYGIKCSIQESSLATEACIWLGVNDVEPKVFAPGVGWKPVDLNALVKGDLLLSSRMHLTQDLVRALLPLLQHFVDTGRLP